MHVESEVLETKDEALGGFLLPVGVGDPYLRTLLIGGARSMILAAHRTKRPHRLQAWALEVEKRRGRNRAAVAVANKLARIIWAISTRGVPFKPQFDIQNAPKTVPA